MHNKDELKQIVSNATITSTVRRKKISHAEAYKLLVKKLKAN